MDQLAKQKQNLTAAQKAELEARQRHEAAKNKVTWLRSNLERLQSAHDSQIGVLGRERKSYVTTRNGRLCQSRYSDEQGRRHEIVRRATNRTHARELRNQILRELEDRDAQTLNAARMTLRISPRYFEEHCLKPTEPVSKNTRPPIIGTCSGSKTLAIKYQTIRRKYSLEPVLDRQSISTT
jgi:hypothetical protein